MAEAGWILITAVIAGVVLDLAVGDPAWAPHPVRWIGRLIALLERAALSVTASPAARKSAGVVLALVTVGAVYLLARQVLAFAWGAHPVFYFLAASYMVWTSLAVRSLAAEALAVVDAFATDGTGAARERLSMIVGRDTHDLDPEGIMRATAETVSENASDGVVAPLFYLALGGPPLMLAYKAVNTLDSMVGYKSERHMHLGWFSARLDDAANFVPSRVTALLMVGSSAALGLDWRGAWQTLLRDGRNHPSPNAGRPEAAVAGALGVRFGGSSTYGGVVSEKPWIGTGSGCTEWSVRDAVSMMRFSAVAMTVLVVAVMIILW